MELDKTDLAILRILQEDGRINNSDLADKIFLSASSCLRRVRALEQAGFIAGYHAVLDPNVVGLEVDAFVQVVMRHDVDQWHESFSEQIRQWPEVVACFIITGEANYLLRVRARNLKHYATFIMEHLHKASGVLDIRSSIVLQALKESHVIDSILIRDLELAADKKTD